MARTILLKGEVPIFKSELDALRRKARELEDYLAAIRSPEVEALRQRAMTIRRAPVSQLSWGWSQGVMEYEQTLGEALLARLREEES